MSKLTNRLSSALFMGALSSFITLFSFHALAIEVFMAGDSTMAIKDPKDYPETGWGMPFAHFFAQDVTVTNLARNGRSTKTFIAEGLWDKIEQNLKPGDFVFIQFGHNDQSKHKVDRYTSPEQYESNIRNMIHITQNKRASVILMTPITRRHFDDNAQLKLTHPYADIVRNIAKDTNVSFIDMETLTREHFQQQGLTLSALRFMHIKPDLHPNYPNGITDNTHLNQLGAREVAQLVLTELKAQKHPLSKLLRTPDPKHLTYSYKGL
ncbi:rhamnogalacturonan acetylesterase [Psychrosphaera sp. F3M07]|uniref:rhamnogalacturonan acetylesterase n=1 Tax=Psychrosphaera sp. F3M07 TaxID=2841560 RepID=UPI002091B3B6|nr:rhamnogalacturonan acetylesterase [Psychrosphaera sp. F3M07]